MVGSGLAKLGLVGTVRYGRLGKFGYVADRLCMARMCEASFGRQGTVVLGMVCPVGVRSCKARSGN